MSAIVSFVRARYPQAKVVPKAWGYAVEADGNSISRVCVIPSKAWREAMALIQSNENRPTKGSASDV